MCLCYCVYKSLHHSCIVWLSESVSSRSRRDRKIEINGSVTELVLKPISHCSCCCYLMWCHISCDVCMIWYKQSRNLTLLTSSWAEFLREWVIFCCCGYQGDLFRLDFSAAVLPSCFNNVIHGILLSGGWKMPKNNSMWHKILALLTGIVSNGTAWNPTMRSMSIIRPHILDCARFYIPANTV